MPPAPFGLELLLALQAGDEAFMGLAQSVAVAPEPEP